LHLRSENAQLKAQKANLLEQEKESATLKQAISVNANNPLMLKKRILQLVSVLKVWGIPIPNEIQQQHNDSLLMDEEELDQLSGLSAHRQYTILMIRQKMLLEQHASLVEKNENLKKNLNTLQELLKSTLPLIQLDFGSSFEQLTEITNVRDT